jgi:quinol monooxygenase YgiN
MSHLELSAHMKVRSGELEGFTEQVAECIRLTREMDTQTLRYDWFLSSDGAQCELHETYASVEGLVEHRVHVGEAVDTLFRLYADDHLVTVYGDQSRELPDLTDRYGMTENVRWFTFLGGLEASPPV